MRYSYDRTARTKNASISSEAKRAFEDEVYPRIIAPIMEKAKREISMMMEPISLDQQWPNKNIEYSVMRHRPMKMLAEDFINEVMDAFIDWTKGTFEK